MNVRMKFKDVKNVYLNPGDCRPLSCCKSDLTSVRKWTAIAMVLHGSALISFWGLHLNFCSRAVCKGFGIWATRKWPSTNTLSLQTFCSEANLKVLSNLSSLRDPIQLKNFDNMKRISDAVCESGRPVQTNPVGF